MSERDGDPYAPHLRRNFAVMGLDIALFIGGVNFSAWSTILPLFVRHLTGSNLVLGLMPAVRNLALYLPPVLVSPHVQRLHRYKPFILWITILERLPYLVLAVACLALGAGHPLGLLLIFFAMQAIWSVGSGIGTPAWLHLISLMIPIRLRGRFFGLSSAMGGLVGVGAAVLTTIILRSYPFPQSFALCFLATFVMLVLSFIALVLGYELPGEPDEQPRPAVAIAVYLRALPAFLRRQRNFAIFLLASALANITVAISPFVTVAASRVLGVADDQVAVYNGVLLATSTVGSLGWGWLGDHAGYRPVLVAGTAAGLGCMLLALGALGWHDAAMFYAVFALLGAFASATQLAAFTVVTEFGTEEERPTFIALSSLVLAPVAVCAPVLGGLVADSIGYGAIFVGAALALIAALALYGLLLRDPRAA